LNVHCIEAYDCFLVRVARGAFTSTFSPVAPRRFNSFCVFEVGVLFVLAGSTISGRGEVFREDDLIDVWIAGGDAAADGLDFDRVSLEFIAAAATLALRTEFSDNDLIGVWIAGGDAAADCLDFDRVSLEFIAAAAALALNTEFSENSEEELLVRSVRDLGEDSLETPEEDR